MIETELRDPREVFEKNPYEGLLHDIEQASERIKAEYKRIGERQSIFADIRTVLTEIVAEAEMSHDENLISDEAYEKIEERSTEIVKETWDDQKKYLEREVPLTVVDERVKEIADLKKFLE